MIKIPNNIFLNFNYIQFLNFSKIAIIFLINMILTSTL